MLLGKIDKYPPICYVESKSTGSPSLSLCSRGDEMKKEFYNLSECEPFIRAVLEKGGAFPFYPQGTSMEPAICAGRDMVVLSPLPGQLKKYQIVLYKRDNGAFVLHRIIHINDSSFTMRGDHQFLSEPGIRREQMIGIVTELVRDGRTIHINDTAHRILAVLWVRTAFLRRVWRRFLASIRSALHKLV